MYEYAYTGVTKLLQNPARLLTLMKDPRGSFKAIKRRTILDQPPGPFELNHAFADNKYEMIRSHIAERSFKLLNKYLHGERRQLDELLGNRTYVFIIGSARTGGTYLTQNLSELLCSYDDYDPIVHNESIPLFDHLALSDIPEHRSQSIYELIQWILWINIQYDEHSIIIKKCSGFSYDMELIESFFGDCQTKYIITTRHPASVYRSIAEKENRVIPDHDDSYLFPGESPDWWINASDKLRSLHYWHTIYYSLAESCKDINRSDFQVIKYGEHEELIMRVIKNLRPELIDDAEQLIAEDPFQLTDREFQDFWFSPITRSIIDDVSSKWESAGLSFPVEHENIEM
jgi:hypothetical protein